MSLRYLRRSRLTSKIVTLAPIPADTFAALVPTFPPPITNILAGFTPGTPPNKTPRPPRGSDK